MYPAKFDYYRPGSVAEAVSLLQQHADAKVLAGGHSLIPTMKLRLAQPPVLVDIGRISALRGISESGGSIRIGALTTHADLASSQLLQQKCRVVAEAAGLVGDPAVRHKGTIGGNIAHADPASDLPAVVLALGATIHVAGPGGERQIKANDFFVDLLTTALQADEILTAVVIPVASGKTGSAYQKFEHPASGYAICGAAAVISLAGDGTCARASLCFNGVTAKAFDASSVAGALAGKSVDDAAIDQAVNNNLSIGEPIGDIHASGPYRVELAKVYGRRALKLARDRARG